LMCSAVLWVARRHPEAGPAGERSTWHERFVAFKDIWGIVCLFALVMGGIYGGLFTATEAAGIGAFGAFCFALARRVLTWRSFLEVLAESARTTAMLFMILIGAMMFANFVNFTALPTDLKNLVTRFEVHPLAVVIAICVIYAVLGTAMEELSMILLTVPIFFPLIVHLGFDPTWFGVLIVMVVMLGMISPPVGMNLFVLNTLLPDVPLRTIFRGVWPFIIAQLLCLALLIAFPQASLWLANKVN
jgi:C4-dicarboxylate transporter, DctM subunit